MSRQEPASPRTLLLVALIATGAGLYFSLVGIGAVPIPGGAENLHGPLWIVLCVGLAFLLGGAAVALQGAAGADPATGELPRDAPRWVRIAQYLIVLALFACFGLIGSWVAFGPGERAFGGTVPVGAIGGRIAFGIGAMIVWLCLIAVAVSQGRKLFGQRSEQRVANGE